MKVKILSPLMIVISILISNSLFAQDTSHTKLVDKYYPVNNTPAEPAPVLDKVRSEPVNSVVEKPVTSTIVNQSPSVNRTNYTVTPVAKTSIPETSVSQVPVTQNNVYQDTRLGSSAPENDTYKTNNNGAGSITTNPNKGSSGNISNPSDNRSVPATIYRDTRLGSSSPLYNTYEKNDNGAGAITTNPNKG
jgi:hypothetical protein